MPNKLAVSIISNIFNPVGPAVTGGLEVFNYFLAKDLEEKGIDIKLYASGDSAKLKSLVPLCEKSLAFSQSQEFLAEHWNYRRMTVEEFGIYTKFIQEQKNDRLIHFGLVNFLPIYLAVKKGLPMLTTLHMPIENRHYQILLELMSKKELEQANFVAVTEAQVKNFPFVRAVVPNGINLENFEFSSSPKNQFIWIGRFVNEKGCLEAIQAAKKSRVNLNIGGSPKQVEEDYFNKVQSFFGEEIHYQGFVKADQRSDFYNSRALLFPINWEEPFGLVMIEAMACGTPVIAYNRGSVPEIVEDQKTGFIVKDNSIDGLVDAIGKIQNMPNDKYLQMRENCRRHVEKNFTFQKVIEKYLAIYQEIFVK